MPIDRTRSTGGALSSPIASSTSGRFLSSRIRDLVRRARFDLQRADRQARAAARRQAEGPKKTRKTYPADALGITVRLVKGPFYACDGRTSGAAIQSDTLVHVDSRLSLEDRRRCASVARQHILERLPAGELDELAGDILAAELKLSSEPDGEVD